MTDPLDAWIVELAAALEVDPTVLDRDLLLEVSRAAHGVARAGGPTTTIFLVGLAAGLSGGSAAAVTRALTHALTAAQHTALARTRPGEGQARH